RLRPREHGAGAPAGVAQPGRRPRSQPLLLRRRAVARAAVLDEPVRLVPGVLPDAAAAFGERVPAPRESARRVRGRRVPFDVRQWHRSGAPGPGPEAPLDVQAPSRALAGGSPGATIRSPA